jgi:hypothetical protein
MELQKLRKDPFRMLTVCPKLNKTKTFFEEKMYVCVPTRWIFKKKKNQEKNHLKKLIFFSKFSTKKEKKPSAEKTLKFWECNPNPFKIYPVKKVRFKNRTLA